MTQYLEFDGYCPESNLKGEKVRMRLNDMDFWESEKTGLQLTVFPPYAAILQWRGEGKFRDQIQFDATDSSGLFLAMAQRRRGYEIFPDEKNVFEDTWDLDEYICQLDGSHQQYNERKFDDKDPIFREQSERLKLISKEQYEELNGLFEKGKNDTESVEFKSFHKMLYTTGLIFNFKWMRWYEADEFLNNPQSDYSKLSLLKVAMLLTLICRGDRYNPGTFKRYLDEYIVEKLINRLNKLAKSG